MSNNIGLSRRQRVFAVPETTRGTAVHPSASHYVRPAGDCVVNQTPQFSDSQEKADSLNLLDRFPNATPAGTWTLPFYARPAGTLDGTTANSVPQGDVLFQSLMGKKLAAPTLLLASDIDDQPTTTTVSYDTLSGSLPDSGVVKIGTELIYYGSITRSDDTSGQLTECVRGYGDTTIAAHTDGDAVTLESVVYLQDTTSPSFTLWVETDFFVQGLTGCSPTAARLSIKNDGAVTWNMNGSGMKMIWAGKDKVVTGTGSSTSLVVSDAKKYTAGVKIYNVTADDDNSGSGYEVLAVDVDTNTLTLSPALPSGGWTADDEIKGFLPQGEAVGDPILSRDTGVKLGGAQAKLRSTEFSFNVPKQYIVDEVGTDYPEDYIEQTRDITSSLNLYFRSDELKYFYDGYNDNQQSLEFTFGDAVGKQMVVSLPKVQLTVPTVAFQNPAVALTMEMKALGTMGEDSAVIRFE